MKTRLIELMQQIVTSPYEKVVHFNPDRELEQMQVKPAIAFDF
jgi:hypothetical protein